MTLLEATEPAEACGLERDQVRLLVATPEALADRSFRDLPDVLSPGDLLVVNTSATLPAAVPADGGTLRVHLSTRLPNRRWIVELRLPTGVGSAPYGDARLGQRLTLPDGGAVDLVAAYAPPRLWEAEVHLPGGVLAYLARHGRPIRYGYVTREWPLAAYQTVYADEPGSAEMPSAGRPFTTRVLDALGARGIGVARLVLHCGVSSQEEGEPPYPEPYRVPPETAAQVNAARRVIAVGTTVARALETVADDHGRVHPGEGWTNLVITPERGVRALDGILSGLHAPGASHLALLEAVAGSRDLLDRSYAHALAHGYRWHEFGDVHLLIGAIAPPARRAAGSSIAWMGRVPGVPYLGT